jgi:hypothetical protein
MYYDLQAIGNKRAPLKWFNFISDWVYQKTFPFIYDMRIANVLIKSGIKIAVGIYAGR